MPQSCTQRTDNATHWLSVLVIIVASYFNCKKLIFYKTSLKIHSYIVFKEHFLNLYLQWLSCMRHGAEGVGGGLSRVCVPIKIRPSLCYPSVENLPTTVLSHS